MINIICVNINYSPQERHSHHPLTGIEKIQELDINDLTYYYDDPLANGIIDLGSFREDDYEQTCLLSSNFGIGNMISYI